MREALQDWISTQGCCYGKGVIQDMEIIDFKHTQALDVSAEYFKSFLSAAESGIFV